MDFKTRTALSLDLIDWLRDQVSDNTRRPTGHANDQAMEVAGRLIDLVASSSLSPADSDATEGQDAPAVDTASAAVQTKPGASDVPAQLSLCSSDGSPTQILACEFPEAAGSTLESGLPDPAPITQQAPVDEGVNAVQDGAVSVTDEELRRKAPGAATPSSAVVHSVGTSAPIDPDQQPGRVPDTRLPKSAPVPPHLIAEIESNARAGEPFQARLCARSNDGRPMQILGCEIPEGVGLAYEAGLVSGIVHQPGEYRLSVTCRDPDDPDAPVCEVPVVLVVNADPRALWKDLASDRDAPGWKPDTAAVQLPGAHGRQILLASRRGRSHAHIGALRDDDYAYCVTSADGWNLIAIADGAGSARHSRIGSRIAAATAVEVARQRLLDDQRGPRLQDLANETSDSGNARIAAYNTLGAAAFEATKAIEAKARAQGSEPRDYATTLLLAAHTRTPVGDLVATYWVGDGAIALYSTERGVELLGMPEGGEYAGQTQFLDRSVFADGGQIMQRLNVRMVKDFTALLLMTDGVSDPWFPSDATLRESGVWATLWAELAPLLAECDADAHALDWLNFWSRGNHDDRTLAVLW